jgi:hypothetical protein
LLADRSIQADIVLADREMIGNIGYLPARSGSVIFLSPRLSSDADLLTVVLAVASAEPVAPRREFDA